ncbi:hypothetical protein [Aeoliella sp.]|uniref:hypothetical protein n=1 Tax=Aeoliella sp. TaxID=2795800 RepID=UPI003CCC2DE6
MPRTLQGPREIHPNSLYRSSELTRFGLSHVTRWRLKKLGIEMEPIRSGGSVFYEGSEIIRILKLRAELAAKS